MKWMSAVSLGLGFLAWHLAAFFGWIDIKFFPTPLEIIQRAVALCIYEEEFRNHVYESFRRFLLGQAIAFPAAIVLAFVVVLSHLSRALVSPWLGLIYPIPKLALFPFFLILFGTDDLSKILMIALGSFFLMYLSISVGFRRIYESEYFEIIRVYRVPAIQVFWQVFIKGSLSEIVVGIKLGVGYGLVMMVGSEMTMSKNGLGFYMWNAWDQFRILDMYASIAWISIFGFISFYFCDYLEKRISHTRSKESLFNQF